VIVVVVAGLSAWEPRPASVSAAVSTKVAQTQTWVAQITQDYSYLDANAEQLFQTFEEWSSGTVSADAVTEAVDQAVPEFLQTTRALTAQTPLTWTRAALADYLAGAQLYLEAIRVEGAASLLAPGPLRAQLQSSEMRIRELGDRVYDQGSSAVAPFLPKPATSSDVTVITVPPVPNWKAQDLLPGPPLDQRGGPPLGQSVAASSWIAAVDEAHIPTGSAETAAIRSGKAAILRSLSDHFLVAATELSKAPRPSGGSAEKDGLRLALLIDSEATRTAEAAHDTSNRGATTDLFGIAQALAVIGNDLWDPHLETRLVGFRATVPALNDP
jgi:hypothetical protein